MPAGKTTFTKCEDVHVQCPYSVYIKPCRYLICHLSASEYLNVGRLTAWALDLCYTTSEYRMAYGDITYIAALTFTQILNNLSRDIYCFKYSILQAIGDQLVETFFRAVNLRG